MPLEHQSAGLKDGQLNNSLLYLNNTGKGKGVPPGEAPQPGTHPGGFLRPDHLHAAVELGHAGRGAGDLDGAEALGFGGDAAD